MFKELLYGRLVDDTRPGIAETMKYGIIFDEDEAEVESLKELPSQKTLLRDHEFVCALWRSTPKEAVEAYESFKGTPEETKSLNLQWTLMGDWLEVID